MMKKRLISILMCIAMLFALAPATFAAESGDFPDMPAEGHWAHDALAAAVENGLLQGSDGKLNPFATLKRAEMAAVINRAFGATDKADISAYTDVASGKWYYDDIAKAVRMGTFEGNGSDSMMPDAPITREQAFTVIARAFHLADGDESALSAFTDADEVSQYARGPIAALIEAGYIHGSDGRINPKDDIKRAEFAQVFYNILTAYIRTAGTYTESVDGNAMINVPDVTLKDMKINGDLIIGEGVGNGDVILEDTSITGRLLVRGGGEHSIILRNKTTVGSVLVNKTGDGGVRVRTEEGCRVESIAVDDGSDVIILQGEFNQIAINTDTPVILLDADVTGLTVKAENADVRISGETVVAAAQINETASGAKIAAAESAEITQLISKAENAEISGLGTIKTADVSGDNTKVDTDGTLLTVAEGTEGVQENGKDVEGGKSVTTSAEETPTSSVTPSTPAADDPVPSDNDDTPADPESKPFAVVPDDSADALRFATLEEALAEAAKHSYPISDEGDMVNYIDVRVWESATIKDLTLESGYMIFVGAPLELTGTLALGGPNESNGLASIGMGFSTHPYYADNRIVINGITVADNAEPGKGLIRCEEMPTADGFVNYLNINGSNDGKPWLAIGAFDDAPEDMPKSRFIIDGEADLTGIFGGIVLEFGCELVVNGTLKTDQMDCWGGTITLGENGKLIVGDVSIGHSEDCAIWLTPEAEFSVQDGGPVFRGGEVTISGNVDMQQQFWSFDDCTVTNTGTTKLSIKHYDEGYAEVSYMSFENGSKLVNTGTIILDRMEWANSLLSFNHGSTLQNDGQIINDGSVEFNEGSKLVNNGEYINGSLTDVGGTNNASEARTYLTDGALDNNGEITNNGWMRMDRTDYAQASDAQLETYNSHSLEIVGGSITVPAGAELRNEGYMRITDYFGSADGDIRCDMSGFADFAEWNSGEGNDSHWCDLVAEVCSESGYATAVEAQRERISSGLPQYDRIEFCEDITFTKNTVFEDFGQYWVTNKTVTHWGYWDENNNWDWVELEKGAEGAEPWDQQESTTLTVADGATLTIARGNCLNVDGDYHQNDEFIPNYIVIDGELRIDGKYEDEWEDEEGYHYIYIQPAVMTVWSFGGFDASKGTVTNNGDFEIRYYDFGTYENGEYVHEGRLEHPDECPVVGAPANAVYGAEVRSEAGMQNAVASAEPAFSRMYIREDCAITLTEDLTIPERFENFDIEPGSGLIVEYGATLTQNGWMNNSGDMSVYGNMVVEGWFGNHQNLEIGAVSGSQLAALTVKGELSVNEDADIAVRETGSIVLSDGGWIGNYSNYHRYLPVKLAEGAIPARAEWLEFTDDLTFSVQDTDERTYLAFESCRFDGDLTVVYSGDDDLDIEFFDNAEFTDGKKLIVKAAEGMDQEAVIDRINVIGASGMTIEAETSVRAGCKLAGSSFVLNGVTATYGSVNGEDEDMEGSCQLRYEEENGVVFQVDSTEWTRITLTGALDGFGELRLQQGCIDISQLDTKTAEINLNARACEEDTFRQLTVDIGAHDVFVECGGDYRVSADAVDAVLLPIELIAEEGAVVTVRGAQMFRRSDGINEVNDYEDTSATSVTVNGDRLNPHIFGTYDVPAVYIGTSDAEIRYTLMLGEQALQYDKQLEDDDGDSKPDKTHLYKVADPWFTATQDAADLVALIIELPSGVTVAFDQVPVKPEPPVVP